ncbi:MAG: hypothetical protein KC620_09600 [Myxococcales bacterium]|nr:hypothetical protein [Myxococcales bacterium]
MSRSLLLAAALLAGCLEAPVLRACYADPDCPAGQACVAGACAAVEGPDARRIDGGLDGTPPPDAAADATPHATTDAARDQGPPDRPDGGPPPVVCHAGTRVRIASVADRMPPAGLRLDDGRLVLTWSGADPPDADPGTGLSVTCIAPNDMGALPSLYFEVPPRPVDQRPAIARIGDTVFVGWVVLPAREGAPDEAPAELHLTRFDTADGGCRRIDDRILMTSPRFDSVSLAPYQDRLALGVVLDTDDVSGRLQILVADAGGNFPAPVDEFDAEGVGDSIHLIAHPMAGLLAVWSAWYDQVFQDDLQTARIETNAASPFGERLTELMGPVRADRLFAAPDAVWMLWQHLPVEDEPLDLHLSRLWPREPAPVDVMVASIGLLGGGNPAGGVWHAGFGELGLAYTVETGVNEMRVAFARFDAAGQPLSDPLFLSPERQHSTDPLVFATPSGYLVVHARDYGGDGLYLVPIDCQAEPGDAP